MAKKVRFRLWFRKLNIKRSNNASHSIKRRSFLSSPPHPLDILGLSATSASPLQARHSSSTSPDTIISVSLLSSPCHSLPVAFSSPRHSLSTTFCSPRHSLPAASLPRHGRKTYKPSKHQANFSSAVLLSPINCKALDIPYPSGGSSPAYTSSLQSPTLQATIAMSPAANIFSPPICKPHTVLFKSPLHPLAQQNSGKPSIEPKMVLSTHCTDAKISARSSRKLAENSISSFNRSHADCFANRSQAEEESHLITGRPRKAQQRRGIHANPHVKQSPFIVDCGCHPNFSSSFRKTKETLRACGSCSGTKPGVASVHSNSKVTTQKHNMLGALKSSINDGESKNSINCCREDTFSVSALQDHKKLQLKKRKKRMDGVEVVAAPKSPQSLFKQQQFAHQALPLMINESSDANNREIKMKKAIGNAHCDPPDSSLASSFSTSYTRDAALLMEAHTLAWEKDFSSFTSEDTFFSSFERSRPSFSSNSSSECFDKKLIYSKPASLHANVVPPDANMLIKHAKSSIKRSTDDLNCANLALSSSGSIHVPKDAKIATSPGGSSQSLVEGLSFNKLQHTLRSMSCKGRDPLVEVSFNAVDMRDGSNEVALTGDTHICAEAARSEHPPRSNTNHGMKKSSRNPLVKIKEDSCEEGSTDTVELNNAHSSQKSKSTLRDPNLQEKFSLNPDYMSSCHSDYYTSTRAHLQRSARVRKKSDVQRSKGTDTRSTRMRRRAHLQAKWGLSDERIHWQSSAEDELSVDHDMACKGLSSQLMDLNVHGGADTHTPTNLNMPRRRPRDIKQRHTEPVNASFEASKTAPSVRQSSASRTNTHVIVDAAQCAAVQMMQDISDTTALKCEAERVVKTEENPDIVDNKRSYAYNPRLIDSVAVVKCSKDPLIDFKESMVDMIIEKQIFSAADLGELLQCFLSLNAHEHHDVIVQAFGQVWGKLFQES